MTDTKIAYLISFVCLALAAGVQWWQPIRREARYPWTVRLAWINRFVLLAAAGMTLWRLIE